MRWVAFDSKDYKRGKRTGKGHIETSFFTPLEVGVAFDDPEEFTRAYLKSTAELSKEFGVEKASCIYSSSMLKGELGNSKATAFIQKLIDSTSRHVEHVHFSYMVLSPKSIKEVIVGGERCAKYPVKTEEFLRNLSPMFSYISAWNYSRYTKDGDYKIMMDAFTSKETTAWKELKRSHEVSIVSHGDEVNPMISYADNVAFLTDAKLYRANLNLSSQNLASVWNGVFDVRSNYIDGSRIHKVKWLNENHIDVRKYMLKPTVFYIADDTEAEGVNSFIEKPSVIEKKSKRLMELQPVVNAISFAAINGYSFRFYDPYLDEKYVSDGDIVVYAGNRSKEHTERLQDQFEISVYKAKEIKRKLNGLHDT